MFFKIDVLKNFGIFIGGYLCWSLYSIKFQAWRPTSSLKRDSNSGIFVWISRIFKNSLPYWTPPVAVSIWSKLTWKVNGVATIYHCVKRVLVRSFSGSYLSAFGLNTDQKNSKYEQFSRTIHDFFTWLSFPLFKIQRYIMFTVFMLPL